MTRIEAEIRAAAASLDPKPPEGWRDWGLRRVAHTAGLLARHLRPGWRALDVSSSPHMACLLALATPGVGWSHTDHDGNGALDLRAGGRGFSYRPSVYPLSEDCGPPPGGPYDAVTLFEVVEHLPFNPSRLFASLAGGLKPGGLLVLSTPNVGGLGPVRHALRGGAPYQTPFFPREPWHHAREYGAYEVRRMLEWAGYDVVAQETADLHAGDPGPWHRLTGRACLALLGLLALDAPAVRHALKFAGSTQFAVARAARPPRPGREMPRV